MSKPFTTWVCETNRHGFCGLNRCECPCHGGELVGATAGPVVGSDKGGVTP